MRYLRLSVMFLFLISIITPISGCLQDEIYPGNETDSVKVVSLNIRTVTQLPSILKESSGIVVTSPIRFWSHCDSGNPNEIYLIDSLGNHIKTLTITNVQNVDWEDLAVDNQERIYIDDAGNNNNSRTDLAIYRIPNPNTVQGSTIAAEIIRFSFEDQTEFPPPLSNRNFDIEAMIWKSDSIFMFSKDRSTPITGYTKLYKLPDAPGTHIAMLVDSFYVDNQEYSARITAADINHETGELVLLTRTRILSFTNYPNNNFFKGKIVDYQFTKTIGQAEAIGFIYSNSLYITEEGANSSGNLYRVDLPRQ